MKENFYRNISSFLNFKERFISDLSLDKTRWFILSDDLNSLLKWRLHHCLKFKFAFKIYYASWAERNCATTCDRIANTELLKTEVIPCSVSLEGK